jgi:transcriptional regulator with XRE-family HTH domain
VTRAGWAKLGELFRRERLARKLTQRDFGAVVGMSPAQVRNIEKGYREGYDPDTLFLVDQIMDWESGSAERVSQGGRPQKRTEPEMVRLRELWAELTPEQRETLLRLMEHLRDR